jgi:hypothetical protein
VELVAPGMEHGEAADLRAEMLRGPGDVLERLSDGAKEQPVEVAGVLQCQGPQGVRESKDHMDVGGLEYLACPGRAPGGLGGAMAFGAAPVAARVVGLHLVTTVVALRDVPPEGGSPVAAGKAAVQWVTVQPCQWLGSGTERYHRA